MGVEEMGCNRAQGHIQWPLSGNERGLGPQVPVHWLGGGLLMSAQCTWLHDCQCAT